MNVGSRIKQLREKLGLSQSELAHRAGVAQSTLSYLESGIKSPSIDTLLQICDALGVSISELLGKEIDDRIPEHIRPLLSHIKNLTPDQAQKLAEFIKSMVERK